MAMLADTLLTYLIVALAAGFVVSRVLLPVRMRTRLGHALRGHKAPCAPEPQTGGCAVGCAGCGLARARKA